MGQRTTHSPQATQGVSLRVTGWPLSARDLMSMPIRQYWLHTLQSMHFPGSGEILKRDHRPQKFIQKANDAKKRGDLDGIIQNVQMALTFESDNAVLKEWLVELRAEKKAKR